MNLKMLLVLAAGLLVAAPAPEDEVKKELEKLEGTWSVSSLTIGGKEVPAEALKEFRAVIKGNKYTLMMGDKALEEGTFTVDPSQKPKAIDSTATTGPDKGKTTKRIYELEGNTLKMCSGPSGSDKRPTEFSSKPDTEHQLAVYTRVKK
jgi:uncharacterized protein (TIGR03067 family)